MSHNSQITHIYTPLVEDQLPVEEQWLTMADIPIQMASISRYQTGTAILRYTLHHHIIMVHSDLLCIVGQMVLRSPAEMARQGCA